MPDRIKHWAYMYDDDANVYALCTRLTKTIDHKVEGWTIKRKEITCPECIKMFINQEGPDFRSNSDEDKC